MTGAETSLRRGQLAEPPRLRHSEMPASVGSCMNFIACTTVVAPAADAAAAGAAAGSSDSTCTGGCSDAAPSAVNGLVFHAGAHLPLPPAFTCPSRPPIIEIATPLRPAGVRGATKAEDESVSASIISVAIIPRSGPKDTREGFKQPVPRREAPRSGRGVQGGQRPPWFVPFDG